MKLFVLFGLLALAGCTASQSAMTGSPNAALAAARGYGGATQDSDGTRRFSWAIQANAYDGLIPKNQHEEQRMTMLKAWIGSEKICPGPWKIAKRYEANGLIYFDGVCE